jgi:hypothetical protein
MVFWCLHRDSTYSTTIYVPDMFFCLWTPVFVRPSLRTKRILWFWNSLVSLIILRFLELFFGFCNYSSVCHSSVFILRIFYLFFGFLSILRFWHSSVFRTQTEESIMPFPRFAILWFAILRFLELFFGFCDYSSVCHSSVFILRFL